MSDRFTSEQRAAIDAQGKTIVSASAGSGKTTVMIEKIIRLIKSGVRVEDILAVTFTKKAAAQMKEKLARALIDAINDPQITQDKKNELKRQLSAVPTADISTIHSFCAKLIRSHFFAAGVDNKFRVIGSDDAEGTALQNEALDELTESGYEDRDEKFQHLLSVYWRKKSDNALRRIIATAYESLRCRADYREYLLRTEQGYTSEIFEAVCAELLKILQEKCAYYSEKIDAEFSYFEQLGAPAPLALATELKDYLAALGNSNGYFDACALEKPKFTVIRKSKNDTDEKRRHLERLSFLKGKVSKLYDDELSSTLSKAKELDNFLLSGQTASALATVLLRFDGLYAALKAEKGVLDYNDLEHKALALLENEEIAAETRGKFRYVFVDEYQDVNPVQEAIISKIGGENLFLVGDVKQAIYGFRGSKSKFFAEKRQEFARDGHNSLMMTRNFRSADAVLDAVNSQFSLAMTPRTSAVDYLHDSYMERGGMYELNSGKVAVHFLPEEEKKEKEERGVYSVKAHASKQEKQESSAARLIRNIIERETSCKWYDPDKKEYRRIGYSDIAVLSRKKQGEIAKTVAALSASGLPVTAAAAVNICEYTEVKTLIDILRLIDNAQQDVPLCSALLSAMGKMSADELSEIRLAYPEEFYFRTACERYGAEKGDYIAEKLNAFFKLLQEYKLLSTVLDAAELLTKIIHDTRMEAELLSRKNGIACTRRIHRFIEEASGEEPLCVHEFLVRLRNLDYTIEYSENGGEDSVKVLTMHSSKGLEYPVVILDNLGGTFRLTDRDEAYVEEKFGLAPKAFDTERMVKSTTLLRRLHELRETESSISDELNLYYVALTRAKHTLHMIFDKKPPVSDVRYARSFAEFTDFSVWEEYETFDSIADPPKQERVALAFCPDEKIAKEIMDSFTWQYPQSGAENLRVKSSASLVMASFKEMQESETDEIQAEKLFDKEENYGVDAQAQGLAYHAFLENFDFSRLYGQDGTPIRGQDRASAVVAAYQAFERENKDAAALLSVEQLEKILSAPVFYELKDSRLYREQQFLVSLTVADTYAQGGQTYTPTALQEEILFQGAIDLLAVGEEVRVIDYKYSGKTAETLLKEYAPQLHIYRLAVAKILHVEPSAIRCTLVNIKKGYSVEVE